MFDNSIQDPKWIYGERVLQYKSLKHRFDFGSVEFCFDLNNDLVEKLWTFSDCLNADFIAWLNENLNRTPLRFSAADFDRALGGLSRFPSCITITFQAMKGTMT